MMGWHWTEDASWWAMGLGMIAWVLVLAVVIGLVVWTINRTSRTEPPRESPEDLLRHRFAAGEIDAEEYQRRLSQLRQPG